MRVVLPHLDPPKTVMLKSSSSWASLASSNANLNSVASSVPIKYTGTSVHQRSADGIATALASSLPLGIRICQVKMAATFVRVPARL